MSSEEEANCEQLRRNFENREAIFVEKGAVRVRVENIQANVRERWVRAQIETIPTPGLVGAGSLRHHPRIGIGAGYLTTFSDHVWEVGYGGWALFFSPQIVKGVVELAAQWAENLDAFDRYQLVVRWLADHKAHEEPSRRVFLDKNAK